MFTEDIKYSQSQPTTLRDSQNSRMEVWFVDLVYEKKMEVKYKGNLFSFCFVEDSIDFPFLFPRTYLCIC